MTEELKAMAETLREAGYVVLPAEPWMALSVYRDRIGMKPNTISERLKRRDCPPFECEKGPTGRINYIRPHARLTEFLLGYQRRTYRRVSN